MIVRDVSVEVIDDQIVRDLNVVGEGVNDTSDVGSVASEHSLIGDWDREMAFRPSRCSHWPTCASRIEAVHSSVIDEVVAGPGRPDEGSILKKLERLLEELQVVRLHVPFLLRWMLT